MAEKYTEANTGQCWQCQNCVGNITVNISPFLKEATDPRIVVLPQCAISKAYMIQVVKDVCPRFVQRKREYMTPREKANLHPEIKNYCKMCRRLNYCCKKEYFSGCGECSAFTLKKKNLKAARKELWKGENNG